MRLQTFRIMDKAKLKKEIELAIVRHFNRGGNVGDVVEVLQEHLKEMQESAERLLERFFKHD